MRSINARAMTLRARSGLSPREPEQARSRCERSERGDRTRTLLPPRPQPQPRLAATETDTDEYRRRRESAIKRSAIRARLATRSFPIVKVDPEPHGLPAN